MNNENGTNPTIKTIAKIAGVSHATVSRALNNNPRQSPITNERINRIAKEIGYTPNVFARALSSRNKNLSVGMIVPSMGSETAYNMVYEHISAEAAHRGVFVLLGSCDRDVELEKQFCRIMCENRVGALIISPITSDVSHIKEICRNKVPIIFLGGKTGMEEEYYITMDYGHGLRTAVNHLHSLGHRDIVLSVYSPDNKTVQQKIMGYEAAMQSNNLDSKVYWVGDSTDTFNAGMLLIKKLLAENGGKSKMPTAICCASDLMAIGVIDELKSNGISVPGDISVIGHDNIFLSGITSFSLTTLAIPEDKLAKHALDLSLSIIDSAKYKSENGYIMTASLIERGTTGKVRTS